jgi:hypothetical protein
LEHDHVLSFVENLAEAPELPADITPENLEQNPFLTYVPEIKSWRMQMIGHSGQRLLRGR